MSDTSSSDPDTDHPDADPDRRAERIVDLARHDRNAARREARAWLAGAGEGIAVLRVLYRKVAPLLEDAVLTAALRDRLTRWVETHPGDRRAVNLLLTQAWRSRDWAATEHWARIALAREPGNARHRDLLQLARRHRAGLRRGADSLASPEEAADRLGDPSVRFLSRFGALNHLVAAGRFAAAERGAGALEAACRGHAGHRWARRAGKVALYRTALARLARRSGCGPDFTAWTGGPLVLRHPQARGTVVQFNGPARSALFAALVSDWPVNQVFVTDARKLLFLAGITGLGDDQASAAAALARLLDALGTPRSLYLGFSASAFGALRYASLNAADAAIALSPPSVGDPNALNPEERRIDRRSWAVGARLLASLPGRDADGLIPGADLARDYRPGRPGPQTVLIHGEGHAVDAMHAGRLAASERVRINPVADDGHGADLAAIGSGALADALARVLGDW